MEKHSHPPGQDVLSYQLLLEQNQEDGDICVKGEVEGWELALKNHLYMLQIHTSLAYHLIMGQVKD